MIECGKRYDDPRPISLLRAKEKARASIDGIADARACCGIIGPMEDRARL